MKDENMKNKITSQVDLSLDMATLYQFTNDVTLNYPPGAYFTNMV